MSITRAFRVPFSVEDTERALATMKHHSAAGLANPEFRKSWIPQSLLCR